MMVKKSKSPLIILLVLLVFNSSVFHSHPTRFPFLGFFWRWLPALQSDALTPICQIQGKSFSSPYEGQIVYVRGIVTADFDLKKALFAIQEEPCDSDPYNHTSNAIWVYIQSKANLVSAGDFVEVHGTVNEYFGRTEIVTTYDQIWVLSSNNPLPAARELTPPQDNGNSDYYFENYEAMLVHINSSQVVGATDSYGDTWIAPSNLGLSRLFQDNPHGTGGVLAIDDAGYEKLDPPLKIGDQVNEISGVLDEAYEAYRIYLLAPPQVVEAPTAPLPQASPKPFPETFRLATFNLANLFDTVDDPAINDTIVSSPEYQRRLHKRALVIHDILGEPELIAVQEAENQQVLADLIAQPEISAHYDIVWRNTSDNRGLDTALLYQTDRIVIRAAYQEQACTKLIDGLGPDGNLDVYHPKNNLTCDTNNDGVRDGNRLFSREPLIIFFEVLPTEDQPASNPLILIIAHFKSKVEDTPSTLYTLARRTEEAAYVATLVQSYQAQYPQYPIILAGDLNDFPTSPPLQKLNASGLYNLTLNTEYSNRYSYVYRGVSQVTDYILEMPGKPWHSSWIEPLHINADYPNDWATNIGKANSPIGSSDHDLLQAIFRPTYYHYLPLVLTKMR